MRSCWFQKPKSSFHCKPISRLAAWWICGRYAASLLDNRDKCLSRKFLEWGRSEAAGGAVWRRKMFGSVWTHDAALFSDTVTDTKPAADEVLPTWWVHLAVVPAAQAEIKYLPIEKRSFKNVDIAALIFLGAFAERRVSDVAADRPLTTAGLPTVLSSAVVSVLPRVPKSLPHCEAVRGRRILWKHRNRSPSQMVFRPFVFQRLLKRGIQNIVLFAVVEETVAAVIKTGLSADAISGFTITAGYTAQFSFSVLLSCCRVLFVKRQHRLIRLVVRIRFVFVLLQQAHTAAAVMFVNKFGAGIFQTYALTKSFYRRSTLLYSFSNTSRRGNRCRRTPRSCRASLFRLVRTVILFFRHIADVVSLFGILKHAADIMLLPPPKR